MLYGLEGDIRTGWKSTQSRLRHILAKIPALHIYHLKFGQLAPRFVPNNRAALWNRLSNCASECLNLFRHLAQLTSLDKKITTSCAPDTVKARLIRVEQAPLDSDEDCFPEIEELLLLHSGTKMQIHYQNTKRMTVVRDSADRLIVLASEGGKRQFKKGYDLERCDDSLAVSLGRMSEASFARTLMSKDELVLVDLWKALPPTQ